jgi:hypothetical protein
MRLCHLFGAALSTTGSFLHLVQGVRPRHTLMDTLSAQDCYVSVYGVYGGGVAQCRFEISLHTAS